MVAPLSIAGPLSWLVVLAFLAAAVLEDRDRERARLVGVAAWGLFAAFWLVLVPHFVLEQKSIVEGVGSIAAVPLSAYVAYRLHEGRDSLFVLTRAVGIMGVLYLPFAYAPFLEANPARRWLIETVTDQTAGLLGLIGVEPQVIDGTTFRGVTIADKRFPYESTFVFPGNSNPILYTILVACTGLGSMVIFAGAILAVRAPARRKAKALAVSLPVIYVLNLGRNVFIATAFGKQRLQVFEGPIMTLFGTSDPQMVSYYVADRLLAQFGSVVALVVITLLVVRYLPEVFVIVEDLIYLTTGREIDLEAALLETDDATATPSPGDD